MQRRPLFWQVFPTYVLLTGVLLLLLLLESKSRFQDFYLEQTSADLAGSAAMFAEAAKTPPCWIITARGWKSPPRWTRAERPTTCD